MVSALVFGGQDTTRNQLGCALATFVEHPEQWALLADRPALAPTAVEEVMRVSPAVPVAVRVASETFAFQGLPIPAGAMLQLFTATANRDRAVFGAAEFDITQSRPAQLTFGGGIHYCLGAPLARAELQEALPILAARLRRPRLAGEVRWRPALGIYGPLALPLRFTS
jgi:cytochrome P450